MKNFIVLGLIIGLSIIVGFAFFGGKTVIERYGATVGPEHYNREYFYGGLVQGGGIVVKSAATSTVTWTANDVCTYSIISWTQEDALGTTTVPTAASIIDKCLPEDGDFKDIVYWNQGAAASTTSFTMGTGVTSYVGTGSNQIIAGLNLAAIRFVRASSTAVYMFIDEGDVQ